MQIRTKTHVIIIVIPSFLSRWDPKMLLALQQEICSFVALFIFKYIGKHIEKYRKSTPYSRITTHTKNVSFTFLSTQNVPLVTRARLFAFLS